VRGLYSLGFAGFGVLYLLAIGCSKEIPPSAPAANPFAEGASLVESLTASGKQRSAEPYILPSEIYKKSSPAKRKAFAKQVLKVALKGMGVKGVADTLSASFGLTITDEDLLKRLSRLEEASVEHLILLLGNKLTPDALDRFPTLPLEGVSAVQQGLFSAAIGVEDPPPPVPYRLGFSRLTASGDFTLGTEGCARPEKKRTRLAPGYEIYTGMDPIVEHTVPCYAENSESMARLVNTLTNTMAGQQVDLTLTYAGAPGRTWRVRSFEEFTQAISQMDLFVEVYNVRVLVNFLGWSYQDGNQMKSIRQATWFRAQIPDGKGGNQSVTAPAEHGEVDFIIRTADGERIAGLQWFFGVPKKEFKGTAAFWRPHLYLQAPWAQYLNEFVHVLSPARTKELVPYLSASAHVMRGFQSIYDHFNTPFNSYGMFICSDSMVFLLTKLVDLGVVTPVPGRRLTDAFPILYTRDPMNVQFMTMDPVYPLGGATFLERILLRGMFAENALIPPAMLDRYAVPDQELYLDPVAMKRRLQRAFAPEHDTRLAAFGDFTADSLPAIRR